MAYRKNAIVVAERDRQVLELRKAGVGVVEIAERFGISHGRVSQIVKRALTLAITEPAEEVIRLEVERLDGLLVAMWPQARKGDLKAVDRVLRIMERRARLLGLDAAQKVEATVAHFDGDSDLDRSIAELMEKMRQQA